MATTGEIIKLIRAQNNLTQEELGDILGVKKSAIQKYESGTIVNFKADILRKFYINFGISPWFLIFPEEVDINNINTCFISRLFKLNQAGLNRIVQYGEELLLIDKYRRHPLDE